MLLEKERELVVEYGKKLITAGLTRGTGGDINVMKKQESLIALFSWGQGFFYNQHVKVVGKVL